MISGFSRSAHVGPTVKLPISGKNVRRFLQVRLGCNKLPIVASRCTGVARACRLCTFWDAEAVGDEKLWCLSVISWHQIF